VTELSHKRLFLRFGLHLPRRLAHIAFGDDVVSVEDTPRLVARHAHGNSL